MARTPEALLPQSVASLKSKLAELGFKIQETPDTVQFYTPDGQLVAGTSVQTLEEHLREKGDLSPGNASYIISSHLKDLKVIKP